jgi:hypothetical protein
VTGKLNHGAAETAVMRRRTVGRIESRTGEKDHYHAMQRGLTSDRCHRHSSHKDTQDWAQTGTGRVTRVELE